MKAPRLLIAVICLFFVHKSLAVGTFISAPNRVDMVCDDARGLLYISSGGDVLRYDLSSDTFLTPLHVGGILKGMDLSPDGNTLAVTETFTAGTNNWIYLIDLPSGVTHEVDFALESLESGTFSVAWGNDGALMISSQFAGSGWVPLRRYDPASGIVTTIASVRQNSMLCASGDGSIVGVAESNISSGPVNRYSVSSRSIPQAAFANQFLYEVAVNRNGKQFAVPTPSGCLIDELSGTSLIKTNVIGVASGAQPVGAVFHPTRDAVFFTWTGTTDVRVYQTVSWTELARYDFQFTFTNTTAAYNNGRMKISHNGSIIFAMVSGGVRYLRHNLVIPDYDPSHRLVIYSSPAGLGTSTPQPFGTNWVQSIPDPTVTNQIAAVITNGGIRFHCVGWTGTGSVPPSGTTNSVVFVLTNFSTLTWNFAFDAYVAPPSGANVVPASYSSAFGTVGLNTLARGTGGSRSYQMQFSAAALSGLPIGAQITELRFRQDSTATAAFPPFTLNWTEYNLTMARASNSVAGMSSTFSNNMVAPVLVKSGTFSVTANRFPTGGTPNAFASFIVFEAPYVYQGGDLVMLFRHSGSDATNTTFFDALTTTTAGYGTDFR
ncbi:MAG: hypothetical protein JWO95_2722, partial [Verrucomicrobiales bacterium]|nr:hypothetical protein [Verrucomicrobiales bacterium]